jgi:FkbM family methyltransferase
MNTRHLSRRAVGRLANRGFELVGRDRLSFAKIEKRDDLIHIGTEYGGWVVPSRALNSGSICYCAGCGEDISFDLGLIEEYGCPVFAFDPTPRAVEYVRRVAGQNPRYHFGDVGLWHEDGTLRFYAPSNPSHVSHSIVNLQGTTEYIEGKVRRLSHIMKENGHGHIDLLKIDIEGAEYKVLDSILEDRLDVRVICVEFDECFHPLDGGYKRRIRSSIRALAAQGYRLVCSQGGGNYTFMRDTGDSVPGPCRS